MWRIAYLPTRLLPGNGGVVAASRCGAPADPARAGPGGSAHAGPDGPLIRARIGETSWSSIPNPTGCTRRCGSLAVCRDAGDPALARRAIGRAQCNDAYWHGVFGGLYLPHLREAIWRNLSLAEQELRRGQALGAEVWDLDGDGHEEIWVHSDRFSAIVSPWRGGALEEYTLFSTATNYANTLTRRREAYHDTALEQRAETESHEGGAPSIHDIEEGIRLDQRPPIDPDDRALFVDRVLSSSLQREQFALGDYWPIKSWARSHYTADVRQELDAVEIRLNGEG